MQFRRDLIGCLARCFWAFVQIIRFVYALVEFVEAQDLYLLFDETCREMDFAHSLPPAATLSDRVVSISTMSKSYGLPGIRIGWAATKNREILDAILAIREQVTIRNNALGEVIATHMLGRKDEFLKRARAHIERNRQLVSRWMAEQKHFEWVYPAAGVVSFPRIKADVPAPAVLARSPSSHRPGTQVSVSDADFEKLASGHEVALAAMPPAFHRRPL